MRACFCLSLFHLGLNKSLDVSLKEDVKLMAECVSTTGSRSKAATTKTEEGSAREIWKWKRGGQREGNQQLWQLCRCGKLSHNREVPGQECRTDQPDSSFYSGPTWQAGSRHNLQQLPEPKLLPWNHSPYWKAQSGFRKHEFPLYLDMSFPISVFLLFGPELTKDMSASGPGHIIASQRCRETAKHGVTCSLSA